MCIDASPKIPGKTEKRLEEAKNIWLASVRQDGRPHLVPVWFVFIDQFFFVCIDPDSVKAKNIADNPAVVLALEDGSSPVICEGTATVIETPRSDIVIDAFQEKYAWDIISDMQYSLLVKIMPTKLLSW